MAARASGVQEDGRDPGEASRAGRRTAHLSGRPGNAQLSVTIERDMATSWFPGSDALLLEYSTRRPVTKVRPRRVFGVCLQMRAPHRADRYFDSTVISLRRTGSRW